jgi:putative tryptophan/tyrosine transport system substrate-binding protein
LIRDPTRSWTKLFNENTTNCASLGRRTGEEGRNFSFDFLQAASADEYEALYRKLAARGPDVILAIGPEIGLKSALAVTWTVPIVMIAIDYDPLARGYVTSLARPFGNITGVVFQQIELAAKTVHQS